MFFDNSPLKKHVALKAPPPLPDTGWKPPDYFPNLAGAAAIAFDVEVHEQDWEHGPGWGKGCSSICGFSVAAINNTGSVGKWYFPVRHRLEAEWNLDAKKCFSWLKETLETPHIPKVGANLIYDIGNLTTENIYVAGELHDIQFAEALIDETGEVNLNWLARKYLNKTKENNQLNDWSYRLYGGKMNEQRSNIYRLPPRLVGPYGEADATLPLEIIPYQIELLKQQGLYELYRMECDSILIYVKMRLKGVKINVDKAEQLNDQISLELKDMYAAFNTKYDCNVNSMAKSQIGELFAKAGIDCPIGSDGKVSLRKEWLKNLDNDLGRDISNIRDYEKVQTTFLQSYILEGNVNGRLHCSFHPLRGDDSGTITGRLSCVAHWTPVLTNNGTKQIKNIAIGDYVWTHKHRWKQVIATWIKGYEKMFSVTLSTGQVLTCTSAHKLLMANGQWVTVGELHERFQKLGNRSSKCATDVRTLPQTRFENSRRNCNRIINYVSQYLSLYSYAHAYRRTESISGPTLFSFQNKRKKSNVWQVWGTASQLDWALRRWLRVSNYFAQWKKRICAPCSHGTSIEFRDAAGDISSASYRRKPQKQSTGQFSVSNICGSSNNTLFAGKGLVECYIEKIDFSGSHQVYDITVLDDESYYACGVFSHNSSDPNLQNIPIRTMIGKKIRTLFDIEKSSLCWKKIDYSQIEYRMLAHYAVDGINHDVHRLIDFWEGNLLNWGGLGSADKLRQTYIDNPKTDYHQSVMNTYAEIIGINLASMSKEELGDLRRPIKNVNFGLLYGQAEASLAYKSGMSKQQAAVFFPAYHKAAPYVKSTMKANSLLIHHQGFITTILDRRTRFNLWQLDSYTEKSWAVPYEEAVRIYGYKIKRAYDYRATNYRGQGSAADVLKNAMLAAHKSGVFDYLGYPMLQVHDELDFEVTDDSPAHKEAWQYLTHCLQTTTRCRVPITVDIKTGPNWGAID